MNVLCIRVPTISREWARNFKKVIFVNHDVTAYFTNISSSSSTSDTLPRKLDSTSQENRIFKGKITFLRKGGAHCFYSWCVILQNNHQADWVEGGLLLGWWLFQVNYSDAHYTLYREGATLYTIHCILYSIQGRCHTIIIHYTGRVPRGSACSQGGRRVASSGGFLLAERWPTLQHYHHQHHHLDHIDGNVHYGEHHCSDGLLDHSSAAPLPTRPGWRMFSSTSQGGSLIKKKNSQGGSPPNIKSSISPQGSFCPESLAASHHRWRSVLASTPITLTIQVLRAFQCSAIFTILQECLASLSLASADERHGVATGACLRHLLLLPRPRHQCRRLQELSSWDCTHCLVGLSWYKEHFYPFINYKPFYKLYKKDILSYGGVPIKGRP